MKHRLPLLAAVFPVLVAGLESGLCAQSYRDFTLVRNRAELNRSLLLFRLGLTGSIPSDEDDSNGEEDKYGVGGFGYWHQKGLAKKQWIMDAYAGGDGLYFGFKDEAFPGNQNQTRLELTGRFWNFGRDGYFDDGDFVRTGTFRWRDFGVRLGYGRELDTNLRIEFSPFYRRYDFDRKDTPVDYIIPDDYHGFGGRVTLEQNTLVLNRANGLPEQGYLLTLAAEREQNTSDRRFGVVNGFTTRLPSGAWRGLAHVEYYHTDTTGSTWEITLDGQLSDEDDRIYNNDASKPNGLIWVDTQVGYRWPIGESFHITPFGSFQYLRAVSESGATKDNETFFGGGVQFSFTFGGGMALVASYSYLSNPSRPPVSFSEDTFGEHMFFVGMDVSFTGIMN